MDQKDSMLERQSGDRDKQTSNSFIIFQSFTLTVYLNTSAKLYFLKHIKIQENADPSASAAEEEISKVVFDMVKI